MTNGPAAPPSPPTLPGRIVLVVIAIWAMAMVVPDLYRVFTTLASFGLAADNDGVIIDVLGPFKTAAESPAASAGIAVGDRIDLETMRCVPLDWPGCRSLLSVLGGLGGKQVVLPGREMELIIIPAGGGASRVVHLAAARPVHGWGDSLVLLADTIVAVIVIVAAARLVWIRPGVMTWGFFLYVVWFNPGQTFAWYALLQQSPLVIFAQETAEALAQGASYAGLLLFALRFPTDAPDPRWGRFEWVAPVIGAIVALLWIASFANAFGVGTETLASIAFLIGYVVDAIVLFVLLQRRGTLPAQDQQRMLWVICGCGIGLSAFIFAEIAQSTSLLQHRFGLSPSTAFVGLLYLLNGVFVYFVSVAVLHRRVISVAIPLRYGTILTVLTLAVGIPIVNLHEVLAHYQETFRIPEWVWLFVVAPITLVLLHRLHEIGVEIVDHVLNRRYHANRVQFKQTGAAMLKARSYGEIDRLLVEMPVQAFELSSGALFRQQDKVFKRVHSVGWETSPLRELQPQADAVVLRSFETGAPVGLRRDGWNRPGLGELESPCLAVSVRSDALDAIAIVLFGPHESGYDIDPDEREMIAELAAKAAAGYERVAFILLGQEVTELRARLAALQAAAPQQP